MIELAPGHKIGLALAGPLMPASGFFGYGRVEGKLVEASAFGAIVTGPITLRPRRGWPPPRVAETPGGFILETGAQNPGAGQVVRRYAGLWRRLPRPVIAHLPAAHPDDLLRTARALDKGGGVDAFELGLPDDCAGLDIELWLSAMREGSQLPVLTRLPLERSLELTPLATAAGSAALVIGSPPRATARSAAPDGAWVEGRYYGYGLQARVLYAVRQVVELAEVPLVASGGVQTEAEVRALLEAGAVAVQLDSLLFVDPLAAVALLAAFNR